MMGSANDIGMRPRLAPGKKMPKPPKVHYGQNFALCGREGVGLLIADKWSVVDCAACLRVMHARHDKPSR